LRGRTWRGIDHGLGKAIAYRTDLPQIVPAHHLCRAARRHAILGQTENGAKTTLTDPKVQPEVILYDAELVRTCRCRDDGDERAQRHGPCRRGALRRRTATRCRPCCASRGCALSPSAAQGDRRARADLDARGRDALRRVACGTVLGQVGMALHHKLCHTLGGSFDLPHAETHAIILPHAIAYNQLAVPGRACAGRARCSVKPTRALGLWNFPSRWAPDCAQGPRR
jgi:maleylacetate reductase